jgi:hypothetical protein
MILGMGIHASHLMILGMGIHASHLMILGMGIHASHLMILGMGIHASHLMILGMGIHASHLMILGMGIHASHTETLQTLREKFIWCGMKDNCEDFVINCCNQPKPATLKRNASFKKFDLQQRVSLFQKIRTMVCF